MELNDWYAKGKSAQEYVDSMKQHQEGFIYIYENFRIPTEDEPLLSSLRGNNWRAIILTEDWCGDAMLNIPVFLRIAEAGRIHTHFLSRDENLELMDHYLTNQQSRSIPKIIIIDREGKEVLHWGPRAPELQQFIDNATSSLPGEDHPQFKEKQKEMFQFVTKAFRDNEDFRDYVFKDMKNKLTSFSH
ncbi:thioredoxin family protein [Halobacillus sp. A5]|uniref:thioredoxin family protein n=1 Tax=Halobacillus sp. A5 TaxID=2880263 RepID=UPI0020A65811|nr:thioredoxin family protein [Halobacillus sp. A5]MCP3028292.1 thioredoxin family protein [Halobacillus sp. A5]